MEKEKEIDLQVKHGLGEAFYTRFSCRADFRDFFKDFDEFTKKIKLGQQLDYKHKVLDIKNKVIVLLNAGKYVEALKESRFFYEELTKVEAKCKEIVDATDNALHGYNHAQNSVVHVLDIKEEE